MKALITKKIGDGCISQILAELKAAGHDVERFNPEEVRPIGLEGHGLGKEVPFAECDANTKKCLIVDLFQLEGDWRGAVSTILDTNTIRGHALPEGCNILVVVDAKTVESFNAVDPTFIEKTFHKFVDVASDIQGSSNHVTLENLLVNLKYPGAFGRKSHLIKKAHPDAVDLKMAERPKPSDLQF
ncbi:hypothetical protein ACYPKM_04050 [Pseudomonas aeruginosa]